MKKIGILLVAVGLFLSLTGIPAPVSADCPDYGIVCNDNTCRGWYGTCWSWKHAFCVPCSDHSGVCGDPGPKCIWFKSSVADVVVTFLCSYLHIPLDNCVVCDKLPCSFGASSYPYEPRSGPSYPYQPWPGMGK